MILIRPRNTSRPPLAYGERLDGANVLNRFARKTLCSSVGPNVCKGSKLPVPAGGPEGPESGEQR
jgi:hypothetical protein